MNEEKGYYAFGILAFWLIISVIGTSMFFSRECGDTMPNKSNITSSYREEGGCKVHDFAINNYELVKTILIILILTTPLQAYFIKKILKRKTNEHN